MKQIRSYKKSDEDQVNALAVEAFEQFQDLYNDWDTIKAAVGKMSALDKTSEIIVAEDSRKLVGAVAFVPPGVSSKGYFDPSWPSIRMLVVSKNQRGKGIGRELTDACIQRAKTLGCKCIALHTSSIMEVALSMYLRMGFVKVKDIEPIFGVEYSVYKLQID